MNNKGKIIYCSWGYDMTINDYAVIVEETPKTVECKMLQAKVSNDCGKGSDQSVPLLKETGQSFRLHKRDWGFKGSYPFCQDSKRMGHFYIWNGKANYYNTWD